MAKTKRFLDSSAYELTIVTTEIKMCTLMNNIFNDKIQSEKFAVKQVELKDLYLTIENMVFRNSKLLLASLDSNGLKNIQNEISKYFKNHKVIINDNVVTKINSSDIEYFCLLDNEHEMKIDDYIISQVVNEEQRKVFNDFYTEYSRVSSDNIVKKQMCELPIHLLLNKYEVSDNNNIPMEFFGETIEKIRKKFE